VLREQVQADLSIVIDEEDVLSVVPALCDVVRAAGQHDSR